MCVICYIELYYLISRLHTCHILPPSEIDSGLCLADFTDLEGKHLFHRIGWKGRIWQPWSGRLAARLGDGQAADWAARASLKRGGGSSIIICSSISITISSIISITISIIIIITTMSMNRVTRIVLIEILLVGSNCSIDNCLSSLNERDNSNNSHW